MLYIPTNEELDQVDTSSVRSSKVPEGYLTPYGVAKFLNECLQARGLKLIQPAMAYNYASKGYLKSETVGDQVLVSEEDAQVWVTEQLAKRIAKAQTA